jgi:hypothetical protein
MWISRDFVGGKIAAGALPIKVLKGPRQVGKTSVLERLETHRVVYLDDIAARSRAAADPRGFLDALPPRLVLDEASLAPPLFEELKRRVDEQRRKARGGAAARELDVWITGSNETLLQRHVRESLAGGAGTGGSAGAAGLLSLRRHAAQAPQLPGSPPAPASQRPTARAISGAK